MKTKEEIIQIIKKYEDQLSDGFYFYSDESQTLSKIADEILEA
jgi:hypothetical protein